MVSRRDFIRGLIGGLFVGAVAGAGVVYLAGPRREEVAPPEVSPRIPTTPLKVGLQYMTKGGGATWGDPTYKGARLAVEEINAAGGILGRRVEFIERDEAGADATKAEFEKLITVDNIDVHFCCISSSNPPALAPIAEEYGVLTFFTDGCTDILFEKTVPNPRYTFRITNIQSADGVTAALGAIKFFNLIEKDKVRVAHIHPDYAYGRNAYQHM